MGCGTGFAYLSLFENFKVNDSFIPIILNSDEPLFVLIVQIPTLIPKEQL